LSPFTVERSLRNVENIFDFEYHTTIRMAVLVMVWFKQDWFGSGADW